MLVVDVAHNAFTGSVPSNLRKPRNLRTMNLGKFLLNNTSYHHNDALQELLANIIKFQLVLSIVGKYDNSQLLLPYSW